MNEENRVFLNHQGNMVIESGVSGNTKITLSAQTKDSQALMATIQVSKQSPFTVPIQEAESTADRLNAFEMLDNPQLLNLGRYFGGERNDHAETSLFMLELVTRILKKQGESLEDAQLLDAFHPEQLKTVQKTLSVLIDDNLFHGDSSMQEAILEREGFIEHGKWNLHPEVERELFEREAFYEQHRGKDFTESHEAFMREWQQQSS